MHKFRRDVDHKLRVLRRADPIGDVGKACRCFGVGRVSSEARVSGPVSCSTLTAALISRRCDSNNASSAIRRRESLDGASLTLLSACHRQRILGYHGCRQGVRIKTCSGRTGHCVCLNRFDHREGCRHDRRRHCDCDGRDFATKTKPRSCDFLKTRRIVDRHHHAGRRTPAVTPTTDSEPRN